MGRELEPETILTFANGQSFSAREFCYYIEKETGFPAFAIFLTMEDFDNVIDGHWENIDKILYDAEVYEKYFAIDEMPCLTFYDLCSCLHTTISKMYTPDPIIAKNRLNFCRKYGIFAYYTDEGIELEKGEIRDYLIQNSVYSDKTVDNYLELKDGFSNAEFLYFMKATESGVKIPELEEVIKSNQIIDLFHLECQMIESRIA